jgi:ubiquinone/menaquinone biosynthesis C-methylase UbiE
LELAQKKQREVGEANVAWVIASADALPFRTSTFDYITSTYALRFSNLQRSLPEIRRTIRPGARVAIFDSVTRPARFGFWLNYGRDIMRLAPQLLRSYGVRGMCRIVAYRLTTAGVQDTRASRMLAPAAFMEIFQRYFPEQEGRIIFSPGRLFWQNGP